MASTPAAADFHRINISVRTPGRKLHLKWKCEVCDESDTHIVDRSRVEAAVNDVRVTFRELAGALRRREKEREEDHTEESVGRVANAGRHLYDELIPPQVSLRRILDSSVQCDLRIQIVDLCQLPWGAIYSGDLPDDGASEEPARVLPESFWCIKHNVFAYKLSAQERFTKHASAKNLPHRFAYVPRSRERPTDAKACLDPQEFDRECNLAWHYTWALYLRETANKGVPAGLLNAIQRYGARWAGIRSDTESARLTGMLFIDGIDVGIAEPTGTDLVQEICKNWQGMVVSEVPLAHGTEFCVDLVDEAKSGAKISDLLRPLRTKNWPESLLYSVYCVPDFAFERP
jgi:hypothetical protein